MKTSTPLAVGLGLAFALFGAAILFANITSGPADAGFLTEACGETRWPASTPTIYVVVGRSSELWGPELADAARELNGAVGRPLLDVALDGGGEVQAALEAATARGPEPRRPLVAVSSPDNEAFRSRDARAFARAHWHPQSCAIGYAILFLPEIPPPDPSERRVIALHELGHALGLAHDRGTRSVMSPAADLALAKLSEADAARLAAAFALTDAGR